MVLVKSTWKDETTIGKRRLGGLLAGKETKRSVYAGERPVTYSEFVPDSDDTFVGKE